ncbi:unnamed protein product [Trichobilharzia regenti]|nr:unnamed protein product [Trichobilharzia regenti]
MLGHYGIQARPPRQSSSYRPGLAVKAKRLSQNLLNPNHTCSTTYHKTITPRTSTSPYTGWLTDESVINALFCNRTDHHPTISCDPVYKSLYETAIQWDNELCETP